MIRTVAIIGSGFCGTLAAVHVLRGGAGGAPLRVVLVNRSGPQARGVAYGTRSERHLLNVPAARMSAFPEDEAHFLRFAQRAVPGLRGGDFVPRRLYGEYLDALLADAERERAPGVRFERRFADVCAVEPAPGGAGLRLALSDGTAVEADRALLALGNYAPADPRIASPGFYASASYVRDPWRPGAIDSLPLDRPVLLVGTGLTMVDVALALEARGARAPLTAVSRHGLLPQPHRTLASAPAGDRLPSDLLGGPATVRHYLRSVRRAVRQLEAEQVDWREVVGSLRAATPALWQALPTPERRRFLRHLQPYWDVHRHRMAPTVGAALHEMMRSGALRTLAGRILDMRDADGEVVVEVRPRGEPGVRELRVGAVVNCTGPCANVGALREPLLDSLRARGMLRPDALGLGFDVDGYALVDAAGRPSRLLYYVGPFLKSAHWESTAVPELRVHAARAAEAVRASLVEQPPGA